MSVSRMKTSVVGDDITTMTETVTTASSWARETFGPVDDLMVIVNRAEEELQELKDAIREGNDHRIMEELTDVIIILWGVPHELKLDLQSYIDWKMTINRNRKWKLRGDGSADHV